MLSYVWMDGLFSPTPPAPGEYLDLMGLRAGCDVVLSVSDQVSIPSDLIFFFSHSLTHACLFLCT